MASPLHAGTAPTYLDPQDYPDGVIRIRVQGDTADRVQIHLDGTVYSGNGTAAPTNAQAAVNADFESRIAALEA